MHLKNKLGATWGILGITLIIGSAIVRLFPKAVDAIHFGLSPFEWIALLVWVSFMLFFEGYRGFQLNFSPRFAARLWHLLQKGRAVDLLLAPFYCMGFFHTTRRRMISSWTLAVGVTLFILVVVHIAQPWRGIIDWGVVLGLLYGLICIYVFTWQTLRRRNYIADPELLKPI